MDIFFWVVAVLLIGLGGYTNYANWKLFIEAKKAKEVFLQNHKDAQMLYINRYRPWLFSLMCAACLVLGGTILLVPSSIDIQGRNAQALVYLGLAVYSVAIMAEALTDCRVVYTPDGFMFEKDYIRYKTIRNIVIGKGFFKSSLIQFTGGKEMALNKSLAKWAQEQLEQWQARRKEERKSKGRRKGQNV